MINIDILHERVIVLFHSWWSTQNEFPKWICISNIHTVCKRTTLFSSPMNLSHRVQCD